MFIFFPIRKRYAVDRLFQNMIGMCMHLISITSTETKKKNIVTNKNVHAWQSHILKCLITVLGL